MIFVSHAWKEGNPSPKVLEFVDFLRKSGYEAVCDVMFQQNRTAIHFSEMMADALRKSEKTIIVLSEDYKKKADSFSGGVGIEYRYIIDDFSKNENRYILVSFKGRPSSIIPDFLNGRDIVDLSEDAKLDYRELFTKLSGSPKITFSPVATEKKIPKAETIGDFTVGSTTQVSERLGLSFDQSKVITDLDKKNALRDAFISIKETLRMLSNEYCAKNQQFHIEYDDIDAVTTVFEVYKNGQKVHLFQLWFGTMMGGRNFNIFIGDSIGSKNSFSEMIGYKEQDGQLQLEFSSGLLHAPTDGSIESITKGIWKRYFELYLR